MAIKNPDKVVTKELISFLIKNHQVEISGAFGLDIVRVGQMGEQCRHENIKRTLEAIGAGYEHFGVKLNVYSAMIEFEKSRERESALYLSQMISEETKTSMA